MKVLQFGTGRFLRAFFAPMVREEKSIIAIQSRPKSGGADKINTRSNGYHVWTRGIQGGQIVDDHEVVRSLDRALVAQQDWKELCALAVSHEVELIVSNTTAEGLALDDSDTELDFRRRCPNSFPAKLLALLYLRFESGQPGLTILPMELVEYNARRLQQLVLAQLDKWTSADSSDFRSWLVSQNRWLSNLVDRIVVSPSGDPPWQHPDPLAVMGEPYRLLAIEKDDRDPNPVPEHPMVQWVDDLQPYFLRKLRILNALHTAMVARCLPLGFETVLQVVSDPDQRLWLDKLLSDEILPALKHRHGVDATDFASDVMERFENPYFQHLLSDIAQGHPTKLAIRIQPSIDDFRSAFGREPKELTAVMNAPAPI